MSAVAVDRPPQEPFSGEICLLRERIEHLFAPAEWTHRQWQAAAGWTLDDAVEQFVRRLNAHTLPIAWVAVVDDEPVGMVSLTWQRSPQGEVVPCLTELYVAPSARRRGIGRRLCERAIEHARRLHLPALYLYCVPEETYYQRLGWQPVGDPIIRRDGCEAVFHRFRL